MVRANADGYANAARRFKNCMELDSTDIRVHDSESLATGMQAAPLEPCTRNCDLDCIGNLARATGTLVASPQRAASSLWTL